MIEIKGELLKHIEKYCPVGFEAYYQPNVSKMVIYLEEPLNKSQINYLQLHISKYIGDRMLQDSYKTVAIYS